MTYYVYFLKNNNGNLYIGQTNNLEKRVSEHINHLAKAAKFTREHEGFKLIYKVEYPTRLLAMRREKQLKGWTRHKKDALITGDLKLLKKL